MNTHNDDGEEYKTITSTLSSFYNFYNYQINKLIKPRISKFEILSNQDKQLLLWYQKHTEYIQQCIMINKDFTEKLAVEVSTEWGVDSKTPHSWSEPTIEQFEMTQLILLQLTREWSEEGLKERKNSHNLIMNQLNSKFPNYIDRQNKKILVPGCGLGRLVFELICQGFNTEGNDNNYHMLFTFSYILKNCDLPFEISIFPFLDNSLTNFSKRQFQIRPIILPDISPIQKLNELNLERKGKIPYNDLISITAGSFIDLYGTFNVTDPKEIKDLKSSNKNKFDVVVTEFFLNTGNMIEYIKTINNTLAVGGIWINYGPITEENNKYGIDLTKEDLSELITNLGFKFLEKNDFEDSYFNNDNSLIENKQICEFWSCEKINDLT
ncbi:uncharacterized protein KGF55_003758 [Candida pseudojiufengensis]|uniref:uncharacterized protein n=1 Tax=Candida pseudojiufengensis TaxID=497109 RepID=UPI002223FBBD|nr:uncharacterized protein KGF55_003758 [Candida pseudojiufengensis]KAI5962682.1 hypothetical protein KGF55_003758 [Candida pseudojiufengensis]